MNKNIVITGGLGYIGSNTCIHIPEDYHNIIIIDNLSNSDESVLEKIKFLNIKHRIIFYPVDLLNIDEIENIFNIYRPYSVIHFAGLKSVYQSIKDPFSYYNNNLLSTLNLLKTMIKYKCDNLIFSSSATVYGDIESPMCECDIICNNITSPYGNTKYINEIILRDFSKSYPKLNIISLRYFNPIGADKSNLLGENPNDIPNNLMPYILKVAVNNNLLHDYGEIYNTLNIYGNKYNTVDGTCERDFIHVTDLANAHICALDKISNLNGYNVFNVGTGIPTSVLKLVNTFIDVNKVNIPFKIVSEREGDIPISYCDNSKIKNTLGWMPKYDIKEMCIDAWNFQKLLLDK